MRRSLFSIWMIAAMLLAGRSFGEMFRDGETVCFLGDSITNGGRYQGIIQNYYLTRFPDRTLRFVNAGRSGDTADGALARLREDVIDKKPTTVAIMLGMNDVNRGLYVADPDEKQRARQQQALDSYRKNMETVTQRVLTEAGAPKLIFITPSPFDQTAVNDRNNNQPGCNDGLGRCAKIVRELAAKNHGTVVDFHAPMTAFNLQRQQQDPNYTIIGPDRVHPGPPGLLMMAWLFLKSQDAPSLVSHVKVDAAAGRVVAGDNAEVTAVVKRDGGVTFTVLAKALPFPVESAAGEMLALLPIGKDLNQELLEIGGLADGDYELKIDGTPVGRHTREELARGVNLAFNEATPQFKQAREVALHNERRRNAEVQARDLLNTRRWMQGHHKIDVEDPVAVRAYYDQFKDKQEYNALKALNYIEHWPQYGDFLKQMAAHEQEALASRMPVPRVYAVAPLAKTK
ncbi:MAG: SGNH/GDSL hydrolase family protein [Luteolibacter sp.]|nr:SGNH/GDSL hydrolase family protein [Luteolibacter sp.]